MQIDNAKLLANEKLNYKPLELFKSMFSIVSIEAVEVALQRQTSRFPLSFLSILIITCLLHSCAG